MGGGNGAKSAKARSKKMAVANGTGGGSQLKQNQASMSKVCNICRQPFHATQKREALEEHVASKHSKSAFKDCFPNEV